VTQAVTENTYLSDWKLGSYLIFAFTESLKNKARESSKSLCSPISTCSFWKAGITSAYYSAFRTSSLFSEIISKFSDSEGLASSIALGQN
jgi:hypothetical protein